MHRYTSSVPGIRILLLLAMLLPVIQGCATAVVAGASAGAVITNDKRSFGSIIDDENIEIKMRRFVDQQKVLRETAHLSFTSVNGVLLISGEIGNEQDRNLILNQARQTSGVKRTVNQMEIAPVASVSSRTHDAWITSVVKTRLASDKRVDSTRIKVVTESGSVFLMGLVSQQEGADAAEAARVVNGAKRIVKLFEYLD